MEWNKIILYNAIPSVLLAIMGYLAIQYNNSLNKRIDDLSESTSSRFKEIMDRLFGLTDKVNQILDVMLVKFSHWEDRIKSILDNIVKPEKHDMKTDLELITKDTKKSIETIKSEVKDVIFNMDILQKKLTKDKHEKEEAFKNRVAEVSVKLGKLRLEIEKINDSVLNSIVTNSDKINHIYKVLKAMNDEVRQHTHQLDNLSNLGGKIRLYDNKKK